MTFEHGDLVTVATMGGPRPAHYDRALRAMGSRQPTGFHHVTLIYPNGSEGKPRRFHEDDIEKAQQCRRLSGTSPSTTRRLCRPPESSTSPIG